MEVQSGKFNCPLKIYMAVNYYCSTAEVQVCM